MARPRLEGIYISHISSCIYLVFCKVLLHFVQTNFMAHLEMPARNPQEYQEKAFIELHKERFLEVRPDQAIPREVSISGPAKVATQSVKPCSVFGCFGNMLY